MAINVLCEVTETLTSSPSEHFGHIFKKIPQGVNCVHENGTDRRMDGQTDDQTINTHLVKTDQIYLSTDIDPLWADAENSNAFEATLRIHNTGCHGGWQCWWHSDGYNVQGLNNDGFSWHLGQAERKKSGTFGSFDNLACL